MTYPVATMPLINQQKFFVYTFTVYGQTLEGREAKLPTSFLESCMLHGLPWNVHQATTLSMVIYMASAILYSAQRTKLKPGILSPFLPGMNSTHAAT
jgi:hypothetical protein